MIISKSLQMSTLDLGYTPISISTIRPDLDELKFEEDVIIIAEEIYKQLGTPTKRNQKRRMLLLFCIYNAYLQLGIQKDPKDLALIVGLPKNKVLQSLKMFRLLVPVKTERLHPSIFLDEYFKMSGLTQDSLPEVKNWMNRILEKDPSLIITVQPQRLAGVVLMYYMKTNGIDYDIRDYEERLNIKENSIKKLNKQIIAIDNN